VENNPNAVPTTLSAIQAAGQSTVLLSMENYIPPLVISRNYKNKQLTLLSNRKLDKYTFCYIKSLEQQ
jgi:hypothetical protein